LIIFLLIIFLLLSASACSKEDSIVNILLDKKVISSEDDIIYQERLNNSAYVFIKPEIQNIPMGIAVFDITTDRRPRLVIYGSSSNENDQVFWDCQATFEGIEGKPFRIIYGFLNDSNISTITVKDIDQEYHPAKMVTTLWKKVWFKEINYNIKSIEIRGLSQDNKILYKFP
jgi:hypothetical protein